MKKPNLILLLVPFHFPILIGNLDTLSTSRRISFTPTTPVEDINAVNQEIG